MRPVLTLDLSPRENRHVEPSIGRDVWEIVTLAVCALAWFVVAVLVLA